MANKGSLVRLQKTMIDLIAVERGETEDEGDFESLRVVDGNFWVFHLFTYLCRRMVIHLNLYSRPIASFSLAFHRFKSKCRFDFNLFLFRFVQHPHPLEHVKALPCGEMKW
jgi:hypothetical protein